jgi:peptidoglycan-associated lipoprotein
MNKWMIFFMASFVVLIGCAKKPPHCNNLQAGATPCTDCDRNDRTHLACYVPPPPEPEPEVQGPTPEELLARRIQELLNQILGNKVYFDFDRSELKPEAKEILSEVGRLMNDGEAGKKISVRIEGHTCEMGTEEYNMSLGERRARMVMDYLEGYGIESSRLNLISFGEEQPTVEGADRESLSPNRRAEFKATAEFP